MRICRKNRISVDLDTFNQFILLKTFFNMGNITNIVIPKITGHGYHIMGYFPYRTPEMNLHVRAMLGDCINRQGLDIDRVKEGLSETAETLFEEKEIYGVVTCEDDFNILSEPFWNVRNYV